MNNRIRELTRAIKAGGKSTAKFVLPSALSVVVAFFLATYLRPDLTVFFADGEVITYHINDEPNRFRTILVDWSDENGPRIVSATDVTFRSAKDVTWRSDRGRAWISKFVIYNEGWVTANHITIGIGIPNGAEVLKVVASPNITILSDTLVQTAASYPPYRKIEIERLGRSENAVLTVLTACSCGSPARSKVADSDLFIATDKSSKNYSPVLFLSSQEGTGRILGALDIKDAFALEKGLFPSSPRGYWASSIDVAKNAAEPKLEPVAHMKITMSVDDKDGKQREISLTFP
jgi:hypothetical protein